MAKMVRKCPECFSRGITALFDTGKLLRKHRQVRHPKTTAQLTAERRTLRQYRIAAIIAAGRGTK